MYKYRKMTPEKRSEMIRKREKRGYPPHAPPHSIVDQKYYLLTAACYEHKHLMNSETRRRNFSDLIFEKSLNNQIEIKSWVVLPNHYHLLVQLEDFQKLKIFFRHLHGSTSYRWNKEDHALGRKVWFRISDRAIRSEGHYYSTLNYIHYNPVKHKHSETPYHWAESSVHWYLEHFGREWLRDLWVKYPVFNYGKHWDNP